MAPTASECAIRQYTRFRVRSQHVASTIAAMDKVAELQRLQGNLIRLGTVAQVDLERAVCRVQTGDILTNWLPWLAPRAGATVDWSAPSPDEQVLLLSPGGDTHGAVVLRGIYSNANPAPAAEATRHLVKFPDGAVLEYDHAAHALSAALPAGATAQITADGGVTINGPVTINGDALVNGDIGLSGTATADTDVLAAGISLKSHTHSGVSSGSAVSGPPR